MLDRIKLKTPYTCLRPLQMLTKALGFAATRPPQNNPPSLPCNRCRVRCPGRQLFGSLLPALRQSRFDHCCCWVLRLSRRSQSWFTRTISLLHRCRALGFPSTSTLSSASSFCVSISSTPESRLLAASLGSPCSASACAPHHIILCTWSAVVPVHLDTSCTVLRVLRDASGRTKMRMNYQNCILIQGF